MNDQPKSIADRRMDLLFSKGELEAIERIARGCGMPTEVWIREVIERIADMRGMPAGVINPRFDQHTCSQCGHVSFRGPT